MSASAGVSIVLAVQGGARRLPEILRSLAPQRDEAVEVLVLWAQGERTVADAIAPYPWVRGLPGPPDALTPELWALGLRAASHDRVALTIAHCRPGPRWIEGLRGADLSRWAGVGGPIAQDPEADGASWAIYLQRYLGVSPRRVGPSPREAAGFGEVAGDNALYHRGHLLDVADSWSDGFWELEVHSALRDGGHRLGFDPALLVEHRNGYDPAEFIRQRARHGRQFGAARARDLGLLERAAYRLASPAAPGLFAAKVLARALRGAPRRELAGALPWMTLFVGAWGIGEITGAWLGEPQ